MTFQDHSNILEQKRMKINTENITVFNQSSNAYIDGLYKTLFLSVGAGTLLSHSFIKLG